MVFYEEASSAHNSISQVLFLKTTIVEGICTSHFLIQNIKIKGTLITLLLLGVEEFES